MPLIPLNVTGFHKVVSVDPECQNPLKTSLNGITGLVSFCTLQVTTSNCFCDLIMVAQRTLLCRAHTQLALTQTSRTRKHEENTEVINNFQHPLYIGSWWASNVLHIIYQTQKFPCLFKNDLSKLHNLSYTSAVHHLIHGGWGHETMCKAQRSSWIGRKCVLILVQQIWTWQTLNLSSRR